MSAVSSGAGRRGQGAAREQGIGREEGRAAGERAERPDALLRGHQQARLGIGEEVIDFGRRPAEVDGHGRRAGRRSREQRLRAGERIGNEERHAVAGPHARRDERTGSTRDARGEGRPDERLAARRVDQRGGAVATAALEQLVDGLHPRLRW